MVGDKIDGRGYMRNFAYRIRNTVPIDKHNPSEVIELNPIIRDSIVDDKLIVRMKEIEVVKHVNGLFENVAITVGVLQDGRD